MTRATGQPYQHVLEILEVVTRPSDRTAGKINRGRASVQREQDVGALQDNAAVNDTADTAIGRLTDVCAQLDVIIRRLPTVEDALDAYQQRKGRYLTLEEVGSVGQPDARVVADGPSRAECCWRDRR